MRLCTCLCTVASTSASDAWNSGANYVESMRRTFLRPRSLISYTCWCCLNLYLKIMIRLLIFWYLVYLVVIQVVVSTLGVSNQQRIRNKKSHVYKSSPLLWHLLDNYCIFRLSVQNPQTFLSLSLTFAGFEWIWIFYNPLSHCDAHRTRTSQPHLSLSHRCQWSKISDRDLYSPKKTRLLTNGRQYPIQYPF